MLHRNVIHEDAQLPPPYDLSHQERFDFKASQVVLSSLHTSEALCRSGHDQEVWEQWKDVVFEENTKASIGQIPFVPPLNIVKRARLPAAEPLVSDNANSHGSTPSCLPSPPRPRVPLYSSRSMTITDPSRTPPHAFEAASQSYDVLPFEELDLRHDEDSTQSSPLLVPDRPLHPTHSPPHTPRADTVSPRLRPKQDFYSPQPADQRTFPSFGKLIPSNFDPLSVYSTNHKIDPAEFYAAPVAHQVLSAVTKRPSFVAPSRPRFQRCATLEPEIPSIPVIYHSGLRSSISSQSLYSTELEPVDRSEVQQNAPLCPNR